MRVGWLLCPDLVSFPVLSRMKLHTPLLKVLSCPVLSRPVPSRPVPSRPVPSRPVLSCPVLSCPVLSLRSACLVTHKGSGSQFHVCPRPCLSTCRWARLATHRHWGPLCVSPVLSCPLWPCNHRMCVIAREIGLSPLARTCSKTWVFLRRLHI